MPVVRLSWAVRSRCSSLNELAVLTGQRGRGAEAGEVGKGLVTQGLSSQAIMQRLCDGDLQVCDSNTARHSDDPADGGTEGDGDGGGAPWKVLQESFLVSTYDEPPPSAEGPHTRNAEITHDCPSLLLLLWLRHIYHKDQELSPTFWARQKGGWRARLLVRCVIPTKRASSLSHPGLASSAEFSPMCRPNPSSGHVITEPGYAQSPPLAQKSLLPRCHLK